jgi:hypothetical protein
MSLPDVNELGDLPLGLHQARLDEAVARFGQGTPQRQAVTARLLRIHRLVAATGGLARFVIFGSYVTAKPEPNDVDIVLVMRDDFQVTACDEETLQVFDHSRAQQALGASLFWTRPYMLFAETVDQFITHWQIKRDKTLRGIVEVLG